MKIPMREMIWIWMKFRSAGVVLVLMEEGCGSAIGWAAVFFAAVGKEKSLTDIDRKSGKGSG